MVIEEVQDDDPGAKFIHTVLECPGHPEDAANMMFTTKGYRKRRGTFLARVGTYKRTF